MKYNRLGNTGLVVSRLALGTVPFGNGGGAHASASVGILDKNQAKSLLHYSIDHGINFIDTSNVYSYGESETIVGELLGEKRKDIVVGTKCGGRMSDALIDVGLSRRNIFASCDASLKRLQTDYIDLYTFHYDDQYTPLEETLEAANDLVRLGKVRYIGFSNWSAWKAAQSLQMQRERGYAQFCCGQMKYSAIERDVEHDVIPFMEKNQVSMTVWGALSYGLLTGRYTRDFIAEQNSSNNSGRIARVDWQKIQADKASNLVDAMKEIAGQYNASVAQIAIAWLLAKQVVGSVIIGASKVGQLEDNLGAAAINLSMEDISLIDSCCPPRDIYPQDFIKSLSDQKLEKALR